MLTRATPSIPLAPSIFNAENRRHIRATTVRCCRLNADDNVKFSKSSNEDQEMENNDIWKLFREAQKNILYLNKQRLVAIEELNKIKREKKLLLDQVEQLEAMKQVSNGDLSLGPELSLRIDSMILKGTIDTIEASKLRQLVMDCNVNVPTIFSNLLQKGDVELLDELHGFLDRRQKNRYHIVHICTEMAPVVSVGALAPYITGLSHALQRNGNFVEVILPKFASVDLNEVQGLQEIEAEFYSYYNGQLHGNKVWAGVVCGIGVTFLQPVYYSSFFSRERVYGYSDDFERYCYFSRASLDYLVKSGKHPDVLHIHNWHTAIVGPLFWDIFVKQGLESTRILLTCHGFDDQCLEQPHKLALCGLDPFRLHRPDRLQDVTKMHLINILKGGIVYSNKVVLMSSMHSKGRIIRSPSHGLWPTLDIHKDKLVVAPYGFDDSTWDPSKDKLIPAIFTAHDLEGKAVCKEVLQQHLGLPERSSAVIVGCILSEVSDVFLERLKATVSEAYKRDIQLIFMGLSKVPSINKILDFFQVQFKDENARCVNKYDEAMLHLIFAGSDIVLFPSFHDPVVQVPLKALRYGAIPVSLKDGDENMRHSDDDHDLEKTRLSQYIGATFVNMSLRHAIDEIKNPLQLKERMKAAMTMSLSWDGECCETHMAAYEFVKNL